MSALSLGVVVIEGELTSGSPDYRQLCGRAGKGRVCSARQRVKRVVQGPFRLLQAGAIPVSCAGDILEEYRYRYAAKIDWEIPDRLKSLALKRPKEK